MEQNRRKTKLSRAQVRRLVIGAAIAAVVITAGAVYLRKRVTEQFGRGSTAEISSITRTLASGGTVGDVDARSISLAGSVKLESWAVNEGDYVEAGLLLATVDKSSVRAAIDALNTLMQELDADIETAKSSAIDPEGTNSGGNTKYAVTVTMPRTDQMLTGMNAAISIELETRDGVLSVPAAAICEDAGGIYLCTGYDAKSDALTGPVYITTGISDGENVEVTSGLDAGDSYCYRSAEELKYSFIR